MFRAVERLTGLVGLDFDIGGGDAAAGQDFAFTEVTQWRAAGIMHFAADQAGAACSAKSGFAVAVHLDALLLQKVENVRLFRFVKVEGSQHFIDIDLMRHNPN